MKPSAANIEKARSILELGEKATLKEISSAFRSLSKKWHPDMCKKKDKKECHEKMKEINWANKIIMKYVEGYNYSFTEEKVCEDSPEEHWKKRFGKDPHWGLGWE
jgi:DnaJ-class molecular chaperone